ncbi:unnamed protein product [Trichobilharzia regenti]|nr:unnamed protein product [Trichobilharzia regenti]
MISSRIRLILDDLLWVFTLPQVEAAIVFARSLEHSIHLASEQSKKFAADKAKLIQSMIQNVHSTIDHIEGFPFNNSGLAYAKQDSLI